VEAVEGSGREPEGTFRRNATTHAVAWRALHYDQTDRRPTVRSLAVFDLHTYLRTPFFKAWRRALSPPSLVVPRPKPYWHSCTDLSHLTPYWAVHKDTVRLAPSFVDHKSYHPRSSPPHGDTHTLNAFPRSTLRCLERIAMEGCFFRVVSHHLRNGCTLSRRSTSSRVSITLQDSFRLGEGRTQTQGVGLDSWTS
jgi:hypothetical protein